MQRRRGRANARRGLGITHQSVAAILAAGGRGRRSPGETLKQFRHLGGRPLLSFSLDALAAGGCSHVVVVAPADVVDAVASMTAEFGAEVVAGGATRRESVARGLDRVGADRVVVHDAARPFITAGDVERTVAPLDEYDGAITAVPVVETLKRVTGDRVVETLDRTDLWRVQTPQAFRVEVLRSAHGRAARDGFDATDDAQLLERYGGRVVVVRGSRRNLKLTFAEDFTVAEAMLSAER